MNSRELLGEIQRLNREDKLKILQFLSDELSIDIGQYFEGRNTFKLSPPFRATDEVAKSLQEIEQRKIYIPRSNRWGTPTNNL